MRFPGQFLGSFYSAKTYAALRTGQRGYGVGYSVTLFVLTMLVAMLVITQQLTPASDSMVAHLQATPLNGLLVIITAAAALRALMLLALAIAARLTAYYRNQPMDYATAFRLAGVAYTPVAVTDVLAFCAHGYMANPLLLFVLGYGMLLAALRATR